MQGESGEPSPRKAELRQEIETLKMRISLRETRIGELEQLVKQQMSMLDRYDQAISDFAEKGPFRAQERHLSSEEYERVISLLDRAIARAEQLTSDKQRLETHLEKTLRLLDDALKNQERMAERTRLAEAPQAAHQSAHDAYESKAAWTRAGDGQAEAIEATLAKYDAMLERSLEALEAAYQSNREQKKEISDRDRLLARTLDALENAVGEEEPSQRQGGKRRGVLNSLLG